MMGFDLHSYGGGARCYSWHKWRSILLCAHEEGWRPTAEDISPPEDFMIDIPSRKDAKYGFFSNEGQVVSAGCAAALAAALEKAFKLKVEAEGTARDDINANCDTWGECIADLIVFLRRGAFGIY